MEIGDVGIIHSTAVHQLHSRHFIVRILVSLKERGCIIPSQTTYKREEPKMGAGGRQGQGQAGQEG